MESPRFSWHSRLAPDPGPVGLVAWTSRTLAYFPVVDVEYGQTFRSTIRDALVGGAHHLDLVAYWMEKGGPSGYQAMSLPEYAEAADLRVLGAEVGAREGFELELDCDGDLHPPSDLWTEAERARDRGVGWALAWLLAAELGARFMRSHGLRLRAIHREYLGYYGIAIEAARCLSRKEAVMLGRMTAGGDVENWVTGGPGDHGLKLERRWREGVGMGELVQDAVRHLGLEPRPRRSHMRCRHHRWGPSAELVLRLTARLALRHGGRVAIHHEDAFMLREGASLDPDHGQGGHLGWTLLTHGDRRAFLANDGRCLDPAVDSLWDRYMAGASENALLGWLEGILGVGAQR